MSSSPTPLPPRVDSRADFAVALRWFVDAALARGARTMWWLDRDFSDWPIDDPVLLDNLAPWLRLPQRRLLLVFADGSRLRSEHARFCLWRVPWAHAVETLRAQEEDAAEISTVLLDDGPTSLEVLDRDRWRGCTSVAAVDAQRLRERFDALVQRSSPDVPPTTLGL